MSDETAALRPVPDDLRGVWARTLLQTDLGTGSAPTRDTRTWVRWLQTSLWHADLRIPDSALHDRAALPLRALSPAQLAALAGQQGFAGVTQVEALPEGEVCTWLRRSDYQPPGLHPDAGWLLFDSPDRLIEVGVHEDYNEVWERLSDSTGRHLALAGLDAQGQDDGRRLLLAGRYLMLMRPRPTPWPRGMAPGHTLTDLLMLQPERVHDWLDCDIRFGTLGQGHWHIERATLPEHEGARLPFAAHRLDEARAQLSLSGHDGPWHILEWDLPGQAMAL